MSKGSWRKAICRCGACRRCRDRVRKSNERKGIVSSFVAQGRRRDKERAEARQKKTALKEQLAAEKEARREARAKARAFRTRRSAAFKRNVVRYGLEKARFIANIVSRKQKGVFDYAEKDSILAKKFRADAESTSE